jgi:hypothetical protein
LSTCYSLENSAKGAKVDSKTLTSITARPNRTDGLCPTQLLRGFRSVLRAGRGSVSTNVRRNRTRMPEESRARQQSQSRQTLSQRSRPRGTVLASRPTGNRNFPPHQASKRPMRPSDRRHYRATKPADVALATPAGSKLRAVQRLPTRFPLGDKTPQTPPPHQTTTKARSTRGPAAFQEAAPNRFRPLLVSEARREPEDRLKRRPTPAVSGQNPFFRLGKRNLPRCPNR